MTTGGKGDHSAVLKWYPPAWRNRYGDELATFLRDRYADRPVPLSARLSMMGTGSVERLRAAGIIGKSVDSDKRIRGASLLVLCAWGLFVVAGAAFAKYTEHWALATPSQAQGLPSLGMGAVQVAASAGVLIFVIAALITLPVYVRLVRADGWIRTWASMRALVVATAVAGAATIGIVAVSRHLGPAQTNIGIWPWKVVGVVWGLVVISALAVGAGTIVAVVNRLEPSRRTTKALGVLALAMTGMLTVIFAGALIWWISTAIHAPWFFGSLVPRSPGSPAPLAMILLALMMLSGLFLAAVGAAGVVSALAERDSDSGMVRHLG